jgi:hypothetical protein
MPRKKPPASPQFTEVHGLLYTEDVSRLKTEAIAAGDTNYWPRLRRLVHESLQAKKVIR